MPTLIARLTSKQVLAEAQAVARGHCVPEVVSVRMCDEQGLFSRTAIVTLNDQTEVIVQLKDNEIDTTKVALANSLLGDVVPLVRAAHTTTAYFAYVAPYISGTIWSEKDLQLAEDVHIAAQVGRLIAGCCLNIDSSGIVDRSIIPCLQYILVKEEVADNAIVSRIESMVSDATSLKALPLALCHWDINKRNIIVDKTANVVGLIDWEQANLLPLGMNAWCIRYLAVPIIAGRDRISGKSLSIAQAFWEAFIANVPSPLHSFKRNIIDAMLVGLVLQTFWEGGAPDKRNLSSLVERLDWIQSMLLSFCNA